MKAVQYREVGAAPEVVTVPDPEPGPGQVLLKVTAAGVCHSDIAVMSWPADQFPYPLPMTLGHEGVGTVAALGDGVSRLSTGQSVAVYGPWGCGTCVKCAEGKENYCLRAQELGINPPGLGSPGAMAEYMIVDDPRHLVPLGDLDPVQAVPLTDSRPHPVPRDQALPAEAGARSHRRRHRHRRPRPRGDPAAARHDGSPGHRPRRHRGQARPGPCRRGARDRPVRPARRSAGSAN